MRSELELKNHVERVHTCGVKWHAIRQRVGSEDYVIPVARRCHSRFCPDCSRKRRAELLEKMKYFRSRRGAIKMEITFDHSAPDPFVDPRYYSHAFDKFMKRVRRKYGKTKYFRVVEIKPNQKPHFHILLDRFISHEWVTDNFPECGGGKINWERWIDQQNVFGYITKYVTKACSDDTFQNGFFYRTGMRQVSAAREIYFIVPRNDSFYVVCPKGEVDLEIVLHMAKRFKNECLVPLCDHGTGPPDVFLVQPRPPRDLFSVRAGLCDYTRESLRLLRYDHNSPAASSPFPVFI